MTFLRICVKNPLDWTLTHRIHITLTSVHPQRLGYPKRHSGLALWMICLLQHRQHRLWCRE